MQRVAYTDTPVPATDRIYCDTSFLIDLLSQQLLADGRGNTTNKVLIQRFADAHAFFSSASVTGTTFVTSILGMEEGYQKLLFQPIFAAMDSILPRPRSWKEFRRIDARAFVNALQAGRQLVREFDALVKSRNIEVLTFGRQLAHRPPVLEHQIIGFASAMVARFPTEAMDAFHYAIMRRFAIDYAASSDRDWLAFPNGTLVTSA